MSIAQSIFIVDSEAEGRTQLRQALEGLRGAFPHQVVGEADSAKSALAQIGSLRPHVLLVNPSLPDMDGIELGRQLAASAHAGLREVRWPESGPVSTESAAPRPKLIYVSRSDRHALDAFEVSALDYLLKPVEAGRLLKALSRAATHASAADDEAAGAAASGAASESEGRAPPAQAAAPMENASSSGGESRGQGPANRAPAGAGANAAPAMISTTSPALLPAPSPRPPARRHFAVHERGRLMLVPVEQVIYLKAELKYVTVRTRQREYLIEDSLTALEVEFGDRFVRIHRNALVCRSAIAGFERVAPDGRNFGGEPHWQVVLRDVPERLPVSRRQWSTVRNLMG